VRQFLDLIDVRAFGQAHADVRCAGNRRYALAIAILLQIELGQDFIEELTVGGGNTFSVGPGATVPFFGLRTRPATPAPSSPSTCLARGRFRKRSKGKTAGHALAEATPRCRALR